LIVVCLGKNKFGGMHNGSEYKQGAGKGIEQLQTGQKWCKGADDARACEG
jgi:hypothetical protein